jgi:hypothetical protein
MFAFGIKGRTAECLRRGGYALFLGPYISKPAIDQMALTEEGKAALYFYTAAVCLHDLFELMKTSPHSGGEPWVTTDFFMENILAGIERFERERKIPKGGLAGHCLQPLAELGEYIAGGGSQVVNTAAGEVLMISNGTLAHDHHGQVKPIRAFIAAAQERFHTDTAPMFT